MAAEIKITISFQGQGSGIDDAKRDIKELGETAEKSGGGFSSLKEVAVGALREVGALAVNALGQAATAVAGFMKDSVSAAADFQSGMLEFQAVAGKGVDTAGLEKFRSLFIKIGKELPVSTADVQQAAIELVKGGIDPATIAAGGLETSIKFAAAAMGGDLAAAAETSAKIVGGWADVTATAEDKANLLTHATDLLTKAANASTVDVADLALGLYNVQGTAKTVGLSLDETTTALAELAPRFSNANTAGTAFRNFLVRLQPSTTPAAMAMEKLGLMSFNTQKAMDLLVSNGIQPVSQNMPDLIRQITEMGEANGLSEKAIKDLVSSLNTSVFFDAKGEFVGVAKASALLQDATKDLTDAQRIQAFQTIFGNDAMNAAAAFAEMGAAGYDQMTQSLANANGVMDNAALKQQGLNVAMDNFHGSIEALQITVGTLLLPVLTDLFNNVLAPAVNTLTTLADAAMGNQEAFASLTPTMQAFLLGAQQAVATIGGLLAQFAASEDPIQSFLGTLAQISPGFALLYGVIQQTMPAMQALVMQVFSTISLAVQQHGATMVAQVQSTWTAIQTTITSLIGPLVAIVQAALVQLSLFWHAHGDDILAFIAYVWGEINTIIQLAMELIQATVVPYLQSIAAFIYAHGTEIQAVLSIAWEVIKTVISTALGLIKGIIQAFIALAKGDWQGFWDAVRGIFTTAFNGLYALMKLNLDAIDLLFRFVWDNLKAYFQGILTGMVGWVIQTLQGIVNALTSFLGTARSAAGSVGDAIVSGISSGISSGAGKIISAAKDAAMDALNAAKKALGIGSPSKVFAKQIGLPMAQGMAVGLAGGAPMVADAATYTAGAGVAGASSVANSYRTLNYNPVYNTTAAPQEVDAALLSSLAGV